MAADDRLLPDAQYQTPRYGELHCHSNFSFLDGTSDPEALAERAAELGLTALALTDRDGLYGIVRFAAAAKKHGLMAIVGAELTLENEQPLVLLVQSLAGYRSLCHIISRARLSSPKDAPQLPFAVLAEHTDGLIALTTHESRVERHKSRAWSFDSPLAPGPSPLATSPLCHSPLVTSSLATRALLELFGPDRLFLETRRHLMPEDGARNAAVRHVARELGVRCVATNDVHYATKDRALLHDVVTAIRHRVPIEQAGPLLAPNHERCLKGPADMARLFRDHPEELAATVEIAERCAFALGLPQHQIDALAKCVDMYDSRSLTELLGDPSTAIGHLAGPFAERLVILCRQLLGAPRHLSIHVGGMVISARPLADVVHAEPARMPGRTIIPWDKDDLATLAEEFQVNLIKIDLLGLGMLALVSRCFREIREQGGPELRLHGFRYDERVFDSICKGDTVGLFQIESRAQMSFLPHLQPRNLHDVAISVGAIRPGPGATGAGTHIARRRAGQEEITYLHPDLKPILEQTSGVLLWQEQVMQVAMIMADYRPGEAEQLRRAMTHKRSYEHMNALCEDLVQRMIERGRSPKLAEEMRRMIVGFAGYGFPRAHAYPFAHLALVSATLKLRYPATFYAALLNCQPMGFYAPHTIIWDAYRHGVRVLPVDVNASEWECRAGGRRQRARRGIWLACRAVELSGRHAGGRRQ